VTAPSHERGEPDPHPPVFHAAGNTYNLGILHPSLANSTASNPNLGLYEYHYPTTASVKPPVPLYRLNVHHLYFLSIASEYQTPRTLAPPRPHQPANSTSSNWYPFLLNHSITPDKIRSQLFKIMHSQHITAKLRETLYPILHDALHIGNRTGSASTTNGSTQRYCAICLKKLGTRVPESLLHLLLDCPFSVPVWTSLQRDSVHALHPTTASAIIPADTISFRRKHPLRLLFGHTQTEEPPQKSPLAPVIAACTHAALIERRNHNRHYPNDIRADADRTVQRAHHLIKLTAKATYTRAKLMQDRIYTSYDEWLPKTPPIDEWMSHWTNLIPSAPRGCLTGLPALTLPPYSDTRGDPAPVVTPNPP